MASVSCQSDLIVRLGICEYASEFFYGADAPTMKTTSISIRANYKRRPSKISDRVKPPIHASAGLKLYKHFLSLRPMQAWVAAVEGAL